MAAPAEMDERDVVKTTLFISNDIFKDSFLKKN